MRTTERILDLDLAKPCAPATARLGTLFEKMASFWVAMRNRREISRLDELDDNQLKDIGLTRHDIQSALVTSTFFEDPTTHLGITARRRSRLSLLDALRG
jgi:uncharacterized protein YjiS (DUF1127 family)